MIDSTLNPAEQAAKQAIDHIYACIDKGKNFRLEAGAGAGKTYSLIKALEHLIEIKGIGLLRQNQQIACITYTNVACDEIKKRIDSHPSVHVSTIHAFCWLAIKDFQPYLRRELPTISQWAEILAESGGIGSRTVSYENGYRTVEEDRVSLHHDDVLALTAKLMEQVKFRTLLSGRYPILLIDEYQDTDKVIANALKTYFLDTNEGPLIGLFGDHWQKIYGTGCGKIEHPNLEVIGKGANFRSVPAIVECLNRIRAELPQQVQDPNAKGFVGVYQTNNWVGIRRTGAHWDGDLPPEVAHNYLEVLKNQLIEDGWDFAPDKTKILILTHRVLALEQGYQNIADIFPYNDAYIQKQDPHIAFFADTLEPVCMAYQEKRFGNIFAVLGGRSPAIRTMADKVSWINSMNKLMEIRATGTIGAVLDYLRQTKHPHLLPDSVENREKEFEQYEQSPTAEEPTSITLLRKLRDVSYKEIISLVQFIDEKTPFSTKHGVKGAEFDNVLVVFGRGWNQYNFNQFLEWARTSIPSDKMDTFERNRNLFYVTVSRPRKRLALLFTQKLTAEAIATLINWFGDTAIHSLEIPSLKR